MVPVGVRKKEKENKLEHLCRITNDCAPHRSFTPLTSLGPLIFTTYSVGCSRTRLPYFSSTYIIRPTHRFSTVQLLLCTKLQPNASPCARLNNYRERRRLTRPPPVPSEARIRQILYPGHLGFLLRTLPPHKAITNIQAATRLIAPKLHTNTITIHPTL